MLNVIKDNQMFKHICYCILLPHPNLQHSKKLNQFHLVDLSANLPTPISFLSYKFLDLPPHVFFFKCHFMI